MITLVTVSAEPILIYCFAVLLIADYLTGTLAAARHSELKSKTGMAGLQKKASVLVLLLAVAAVEIAFPLMGLPFIPWLKLAVGGFIGNEFLSIIENVYALGAVPKALRPLFDVITRYLAIANQPQVATVPDVPPTVPPTS